MGAGESVTGPPRWLFTSCLRWSRSLRCSTSSISAKVGIVSTRRASRSKSHRVSSSSVVNQFFAEADVVTPILEKPKAKMLPEYPVNEMNK